MSPPRAPPEPAARLRPVRRRVGRPAYPQAARGALGRRRGDRHRLDGRRARHLGFLAGRSAEHDRQARHEPADRPGRPVVPRQQRRAAQDDGRQGRVDARRRRHLRGLHGHRGDRAPQRPRRRERHERSQRRRDRSQPSGHAQRRAGEWALPDERRGALSDRRAGLRRRAAPGHHVRQEQPRDLHRRAVLHGRRDPEVGHARHLDRSCGADRPAAGARVHSAPRHIPRASTCGPPTATSRPCAS